jgi:two-component sensor histidine kinase
VTDARNYVRALAISWDIPSDDLALVVSELATNAFRYGGGRFELSVQRRDSELTIEVRDQVATPPVLRRPGPHSPSGRGLRIVESLAQSWGVREIPGHGKAVWARFESA